MPRTGATGTPQTLTGKTLTDTFEGDVYDNQSAIKRSVVLTASTDFLAVQGVDVSGSNGLELPATSSLEISSFYDPSSVIPVTKLYNPYKFSVYRNTAYNATSTFTLISFDSKNFDTSNNVDVVTNPGRFTVPTAGFYHFDASATVGSGVGGSANHTLQVALYKNGSVAVYGSNPPTFVGSTNASSVSATLQLVAGDYIEVWIFGDTTLAMLAGATGNQFSGLLVSKT